MNRRDKDATQMVGNRPLLVSCRSWLVSMCEATIRTNSAILLLFTPIICSCENPYKNKVWGQTMEALPSHPCQSFYFPLYQMFSSVELNPFIQLCESQPRSYCIGEGKNKTMHCLYHKKREGREGERGKRGRVRERERREKCFPISLSLWHLETDLQSFV